LCREEKAEARKEETGDSRPCNAGGAQTKKKRNMLAGIGQACE